VSTTWHWFVIAGVALSIIGILALLFGNRVAPQDKTTGHSWDGIEELDTPLPSWWIGLFVGSIVFALVYLVIYPGLGNFLGVTQWSSSKEHALRQLEHEQRFSPIYTHLASLNLEEFSADKRAHQVGRRLFINHCSNCHGVSAQGTFGIPNLTDNTWAWGGDLDSIRHSISFGRIGQMPAWGAILGEEGSTAVAHHILKMGNKDHDATLASVGATTYSSFCLACHGPTGQGNSLLGAPNLVDDNWLYGNTIEDIATTVNKGRSNQMPAHGELLGDEKTQILAHYVKSLSQ
jgi:cytochrome c oxidase cbb3-type subunit 3|tara:strand:- start:496 stop:1365 length:870 start_codon:yes stop_codon:yes gene_type:complete